MPKKPAVKKKKKVKKLVLSRFDQMQLFVAIIQEWGWTLALADEQADNDVVGIIAGKANWVREVVDTLTEATGSTFSIPDNDATDTTH